jgi:hypothetical protein
MMPLRLFDDNPLAAITKDCAGTHIGSSPPNLC